MSAPIAKLHRPWTAQRREEHPEQVQPRCWCLDYYIVRRTYRLAGTMYFVEPRGSRWWLHTPDGYEWKGGGGFRTLSDAGSEQRCMRLASEDEELAWEKIARTMAPEGQPPDQGFSPFRWSVSVGDRI